MEYRPLGRSDTVVSCLGLGGNIFGHFCSKLETAAIIDVAGGLGINLIDTADVYSDGLSEEFIGAAIGHCRDQWIIATKVGLHSGESPSGRGSKECIISRVEQSLRRLKTSYIDIYQMHHFDHATPLDETLGALHLLVQQGKVRYVGASNYAAQQLKHSMELVHSAGFTPFSSTQHLYNLLNREIEQSLFAVCRDAKVAVIVYGAMARGVLSGKYSFGQPPPPGSRASVSASVRADLTEAQIKKVKDLETFATSQDKTVGNLALAWILRRPEVGSIVVGVRDVSQLRANSTALKWKLSSSQLTEVERIVNNPN